MKLNGMKFQVLKYSLNSTRLMRELPFTAHLYDYFTESEKAIKSSQTVRDLGIILSNDNSWTPHIRNMVEVARRTSAWVLSVFGTRTEHLMMTLLKSIVRAMVENCSPLWDPVKLEDIRAIEDIQRSSPVEYGHAMGSITGKDSKN